MEDILKLSLTEVIGLSVCGGVGALVRDVLDDGGLTLPKFFEGKLFLGFIGSVVVGATVGVIVDHSFLTAFFAGFTGYAAAGALLTKKSADFNFFEPAKKPPIAVVPAAAPPLPDTKPLSIPEIIKATCEKYGVSYDLALAVARCESGLNPKARNVNTTGSIDRGLYQINDYYHKDVSDAQADDPVFAAEFFCKAVTAGNLSWWNSSRKCWGVAAPPGM